MNVGFAGTPAFAADGARRAARRGLRRSVRADAARPAARPRAQVASRRRSSGWRSNEALPSPAAGERLPARRRGDVLRRLRDRRACRRGLRPASCRRRFSHWPRHGCINVHASLLPRWRGAAPIQRALLAGDDGNGRHDHADGRGPRHRPDARRRPRSDRRHATRRAPRGEARGGGRAGAGRGAASPGGGRSRFRPTPQPADGCDLCARRSTKAEAAIDWRSRAAIIDRQMRAFDPAPGAHTVLAGEIVKVWRARDPARSWRVRPPGTLVAVDRRGHRRRLRRRALRVVELQPAGGRRMSAAAFVAGRRLARGARFGSRMQRRGVRRRWARLDRIRR